jgi:hypothetical protein
MNIDILITFIAIILIAIIAIKIINTSKTPASKHSYPRHGGDRPETVTTVAPTTETTVAPTTETIVAPETVTPPPTLLDDVMPLFNVTLKNFDGKTELFAETLPISELNNINQYMEKFVLLIVKHLDVGYIEKTCKENNVNMTIKEYSASFNEENPEEIITQLKDLITNYLKWYYMTISIYDYMGLVQFLISLDSLNEMNELRTKSDISQINYINYYINEDYNTSDVISVYKETNLNFDKGLYKTNYFEKDSDTCNKNSICYISYKKDLFINLRNKIMSYQIDFKKVAELHIINNITKRYYKMVESNTAINFTNINKIEMINKMSTEGNNIISILKTDLNNVLVDGNRFTSTLLNMEILTE